MHRPTLLFGIITGLLAFSTPSAAQAGRQPARWFTRLQGPQATGPVAPHAARFLADHAPSLGLTGVSLARLGPVRAWRGHRVVRFEQRLDGLPVFGPGVVVRLDRGGRVQTVVNQTTPHLSVVDLPLVAAAEALRTAAGLWGSDELGQPEVVRGVLPDRRGGRLVWRVDGNLAAGRVRAFVDALSGEPLKTFSLARHAPGRVYPANPVATPSPEVLELGNITGDGTYLEGRAGTVYHYVSGSAEDFANLELDQLATSDGTGFFYNPVVTTMNFNDPFTEVNLYYHMDRVDSYFRDVHGHTPGRSLIVVANYGQGAGQPYDNAFSTPITAILHGLFFGQGHAVDFGLDGDVMYHEFGHFVIDEITAMGYLETLFDEQGMHFAPGGLHEGLADYFSSSLMDDSTTGEYAMGAQSRDLVNDLVCPDDVFGEPHVDGEVIGGATWEIRETLGASDLADPLIFGALTLLTSLATWSDFATAVNDTAAVMEGDGDLTSAQTASVAAVLDARGLTQCGRTLPLDGGATQTTHPFGFDWLSQVANSDCETIRVLGVWLPGAFQYRIDVPSDAQQLTVRLQQSPNDRLLTRILLRRDSPIEYLVQPVMMGLSVVFPQEYDHELGEFEEDEVTATVHLHSDPPLEPGHTYYVAVLHQNCPDSEQIVSASTSTDPPPDPDGGVDASADASGDATDTPSNKGCGCSAANPAPATPLGLLLLLAWLSRRRRRRRRRAGR